MSTRRSQQGYEHRIQGSTAGVPEKKPEKKLKSAKHRIVLRDGRELQFHSPRQEGVQPLDLGNLIPPHWPTPLEIEIGPGKGEFLAARARKYPERYFVGIDRRADRTEKTEKKMSRLPENNSVIVLEDARCFLLGAIPPISVLHVYQPDPWPKARHHKHRFFRSPDAQTWGNAVVPGGELRFSTDHRAYFEEIVDIVQSWGTMHLEIICQKRIAWAEPSTYFEGIFLNRGQPVHKAIFRRL